MKHMYILEFIQHLQTVAFTLVGNDVCEAMVPGPSDQAKTSKRGNMRLYPNRRIQGRKRGAKG